MKMWGYHKLSAGGKKQLIAGQRLPASFQSVDRLAMGLDFPNALMGHERMKELEKRFNQLKIFERKIFVSVLHSSPSR